MAYAMTKCGSLDNCVTYEFICDTVNDMNAIENEYRTIGTVAIVLQGEGGGLEVYIAGSDKKWGSMGMSADVSGGASLQIHVCAQAEVSQGLPDISEPDENTIYLVANSDETGNLYDEYLYVNNNWEKFGGASIDLSGYAPIANPEFTGSISLGRKANTTVGDKSVAIGNEVVASGQYSYAEGNRTFATGFASHAEGQTTGFGTGITVNGTKYSYGASGSYSHSEGTETVAYGGSSHAEGSQTVAIGEHSHAEGTYSQALGAYSHAGGYDTVAAADWSYVAGRSNVIDSYDNWPTWTANTSYSVGDRVKRSVTTNGTTTVRGYVCKTANNDASFTDSKWNDCYNTYTFVEIIGNGKASRSNARALDWWGNEYLKGDLYVGCNANSTGGSKVATVNQIPDTSLLAPKDSPAFINSISLGRKANTTVGSGSVALGYNPTASGAFSYAQGVNTTASGVQAHAEGNGTTASGNYAHVEGMGTTAEGSYSHAEGYYTTTTSTGTYAHTEGNNTSASNINAHAEGQSTTASGGTSHAEGYSTTASGEYSHAEGHSTLASGYYSHAEGNGNTASGSSTHAEGSNSIASGEFCHAEGMGGTYSSSGTTYTSAAAGTADHVEGFQCLTSPGQPGNHAEGYQTRAIGGASHAEGNASVASGAMSHAEGNGSTASNMGSHAEGLATIASGTSAHAEGQNATASGDYSHAEGTSTTASGNSAHAEGIQGIASGYASHAEGLTTIASGYAAHAEGLITNAAGGMSHVVGYANIADNYDNWDEWSASTSYVIGDKIKRTTTSNNITTVKGYICKTANSDSSFTSSHWTDLNGQMNYVEIVGNGTANNARSNARTLDWDGNGWYAGNLTAAGGSLTLGSGANAVTITTQQLSTLLSATTATGVSF